MFEHTKNFDNGLAQNFLVPTLTKNPGKKYLYVYSVQLTILVLNLSAHICSHIAQISNHGRHLLHIFFHLLFPVIIGNPGDKTILNIYANPKNVQVRSDTMKPK